MGPAQGRGHTLKQLSARKREARTLLKLRMVRMDAVVIGPCGPGKHATNLGRSVVDALEHGIQEVGADVDESERLVSRRWSLLCRCRPWSRSVGSVHRMLHGHARGADHSIVFRDQGLGKGGAEKRLLLAQASSPVLVTPQKQNDSCARPQWGKGEEVGKDASGVVGNAGRD